jgi:hypothetical protein
MSEDYFKSLIAAYEKWEKTPEGKKRKEETNKRKVFEIPKEKLPTGWTLEDGGEEAGYCNYWNGSFSQSSEITVELGITKPIQFGGQQYYVVKLKESDEDEEEDYFDEGREMARFDAEKDWKKAAEEANIKALEIMRRC